MADDASELQRETGAVPLFGSFLDFLETSIGSKVLMAVTGIGLWLFITAHLAGNLTAYAGRDVFNHYAQALQGNPVLLWGERLALIILFPMHILTAIRTAQLNAAARPVDYVYASRAPTRLAAKTMVPSGLVVLAFFLYHLAHFTWHKVGPMPVTMTANGHWDAYEMLVLGFQQPLIAGLYIVGQILLAMHLSHGLYSMFQHLGLWGKRWTPWLRGAALVVGYGLCLGFISIPISVYLKVIQ